MINNREESLAKVSTNRVLESRLKKLKICKRVYIFPGLVKEIGRQSGVCTTTIFILGSPRFNANMYDPEGGDQGRDCLTACP
jgi:hypothetical protein